MDQQEAVQKLQRIVALRTNEELTAIEFWAMIGDLAIEQFRQLHKEA